MNNASILLENGTQAYVNGIFYVFNSRYYFMYTQGELVDSDYVQLYVVQVCKEVQTTPNGPVDTGYMLGVEISDLAEWNKVQSSITKIVEEKKNGTVNNEIQYLPINMLVNLKIVSKNKFKLMRHLLEQDFKVTIQPSVTSQVVVSQSDVSSVSTADPSVDKSVSNADDENVIIDYRAKYFEEQDKNSELENQIKDLQDKLNAVKNILN